MKWIKASERLPDIFEAHEKHFRLDGKRSDVILVTEHPTKGVVFEYRSRNGWQIVEDLTRVEWLDESPDTEILDDAHEKEVMMAAFVKVKELFERRSWIMEGRGSYRYDDDRYKEEVRYLFDEFDQLYNDTWKNIKSKTFEYRNQIIAQYLKDNPRPDTVEAGYVNRLSEIVGAMPDLPFEPVEAGEAEKIAEEWAEGVMGAYSKDEWPLVDKVVRRYLISAVKYGLSKSLAGAQQGEGWISVESKLPEDYSFVLATLQTLHDRWVEVLGFGTLTFILPGRGRTVHVSHWMPLPQPPLNR
jgi:hypothetical protein